MILLDTDFIIWCIRGHTKALQTLDELENIAISVVTHMELIQGTRNKQELKQLQQMLVEWQANIIQINSDISILAEQWVGDYFHSHSLTVADALIGATAVMYKLPLLTGNIKHFRPISSLTVQPFTP